MISIYTQRDMGKIFISYSAGDEAYRIRLAVLYINRLTSRLDHRSQILPCPTAIRYFISPIGDPLLSPSEGIIRFPAAVKKLPR